MGERFAGRYELVDHLGDGGTGSVWRAWDGRRGQYVAAKLLRQRDAGALLRFVREQSLRVEHPHVVAPTGWAAEDDDVLLTMDLVRGGSVAALLGDYGALPPGLVAVLVDQLLDALEAVHRTGLVHRDVKPANLLLEPTGTGTPFLRLADFGIAVLRSDPRLTESGYVVGTSGYVAPEVLRGAEPDPRQDLWSVGTVGLQLLTGRLAGGSAPAVPLARWLATLTRDDPEQRPPDATTARAQLRALGPQPDGPADLAEPVEVFDHLLPLPPGWTPAGPSGTTPARPPSVQAGPTAPATERLPSERPVPVPHAERVVAATRLPATTAPLTQPHRPLQAQPDPESAVARRLGRGTVLRLVAVVLLVLLAVFAFRQAHSSGADPTPAPAGVPTTTAKAGDPCAFTDVDVSRSSGGQLVTCRRQGGSYRWAAGS